MSIKIARPKSNTFPIVPLHLDSTISWVLWGGRKVWKSAGAPHVALGITCSGHSHSQWGLPCATVQTGPAVLGLWGERKVWKSAGAPHVALGITCSGTVVLGPEFLGAVVLGPEVLGAVVLDPLMLKYFNKLQGISFLFQFLFLWCWLNVRFFSNGISASCRDRQQLTVHATIQISLTQPNNEVIPTQRPGIFFLFQFFFRCWLFGRCFNNGKGLENWHTCK